MHTDTCLGTVSNYNIALLPLHNLLTQTPLSEKGSTLFDSSSFQKELTYRLTSI